VNRSSCSARRHCPISRLMLLVFWRDDRDRGRRDPSSPNVSSICPVPGASLRRWPRPASAWPRQRCGPSEARPVGVLAPRRDASSSPSAKKPPTIQPQQRLEDRMTKPLVVMVGADKGGVGTTTLRPRARYLFQRAQHHRQAVRRRMAAREICGSSPTVARWSICIDRSSDGGFRPADRRHAGRTSRPGSSPRCWTS